MTALIEAFFSGSDCLPRMKVNQEKVGNVKDHCWMHMLQLKLIGNWLLQRKVKFIPCLMFLCGDVIPVARVTQRNIKSGKISKRKHYSFFSAFYLVVR